jgi:soluble lytic murein transglycosylase
MLLLLILWPIVVQSSFGANLDEARTRIQAGDWHRAAASLDAAYAADSAIFDANNLHYLRGRAAENESDWRRAATEFELQPPGSGLRPLAAWHAARAAMRLGSISHAEILVAELPPDFPVELKMQLARESPPNLALILYGKLNSREARFHRARILNDNATLWALLRERNTDDVASECARLLADIATAPGDSLDIGKAFLAQRSFGNAIAALQRAAIDPAIAAEAWYQKGRAYFLSEDYPRAIETYKTTSERYPNTNWQREAEYQIASSYWRLGQYADAEKSYIAYIARYGDRSDEGATRNLVDVYRVSGNSAKAVALIDRKLAGKVTTATRQVLLLVKAKILFFQERFTAARDILHQLGAMRLVSTPGGGTLEEVRYLEALAQSKLGNRTAAQTIWKTLAADQLSYFGQKSAERLGSPSETKPHSSACTANSDPALTAAAQRFEAVTRPLRSQEDPAADAVADLVFMKLWDEAFVWLDRGRRLDARTAADLAYLAGRYNRAIGYADRLPESDMAAWPFVYPAAYRPMICAASQAHSTDPLWLHAIIWQESRYDPNSESAASARGLLQFIPETERAVGERLGLQGLTPDQLYDPQVSIRLGAEYWFELMSEFKIPELALAAYNGGPDNVRRWRAKMPTADVEFFVSDIGFSETKHYVQAVFAAHAAYDRNN